MNNCAGKGIPIFYCTSKETVLIAVAEENENNVLGKTKVELAGVYACGQASQPHCARGVRWIVAVQCARKDIETNYNYSRTVVIFINAISNTKSLFISNYTFLCLL